MGACFCCCGDSENLDYRVPPSRFSGLNGANNRSYDTGACRQDKQQFSNTLICELCGTKIDTALFDGHREVCKANHLRTLLAKNAALLSDANMRPSSSNSRLNEDLLGVGEKELCVVCMDRPRCYAFLPCGHISCCEDCTKLLDQCPLCRQPREGLCYVSANVAAQYECKHCHELIAPTLFDGHREVCGLRQRQKQREAEEAAARAQAAVQNKEGGLANEGVVSVHVEKSATRNNVRDDLLLKKSNSPVQATPPPQQKDADSVFVPARSHSHVCLECGKRYNQLVVCVPCGHRVLCHSCAKKRTTCPVCVSEIRDTVVAFD
ncbi:hypothetical protein ABB37_03777 [Leptomonas pyrrhocoris]|uniref:RING-type domain-containing protein n=1 Tax=Leptomonas pyrrhocoris TaxID=157538 RepID=A0A0M9G321_LEPPY|nr:hypothetical protein ABB37_03777 [Leptomonas pyrrhocoris]KPA81400.1 hypothetical protein ABB37_03777 [Leptomonas pyrrhocoris]|eukprot:XP_015659839.1 hypothetical protein ABB37_03777 [Leptomonas pyrrhocoris]